VRTLQADFASLAVDAILITHLPNVRYLTGFTGSNGAVLVTPREMTLFTDPRYTLQAGREYAGPVVITKNYLLPSIAAVVARRRLRRVGFEPLHLSYASFQLLEKAKGTRWKPVPAVVEQQRMVKDADEVARIRRSVVTNSAAFQAVLKRIRPGLSESDIAAELDYQQRRRGAEGPAFETIVASGERTALPHARPSSVKLMANVVLLIDMGASQAGYASDMTRMVSLGPPSRRWRQLYGAVLEAQLAALDAVREGVPAHRVDSAARKVLKAKGWGPQFVHSTGHGLGLEIHEAPSVRQKDKTPLRAGMVITIEPGAYIEGFGGIRIEDTVLVTPTGHEVLTPTSKEFIQL
jgi:Xaa-Pro aminopeptidase